MTISINELLTIIQTESLENIESAIKIYLATSENQLNRCLKLCQDLWQGWGCYTAFTTAIKQGSLKIISLLLTMAQIFITDFAISCP